MEQMRNKYGTNAEQMRIQHLYKSYSTFVQPLFDLYSSMIKSKTKVKYKCDKSEW